MITYEVRSFRLNAYFFENSSIEHTYKMGEIVIKKDDSINPIPDVVIAISKVHESHLKRNPSKLEVKSTITI